MVDKRYLNDAKELAACLNGSVVQYKDIDPTGGSEDVYCIALPGEIFDLSVYHDKSYTKSGGKIKFDLMLKRELKLDSDARAFFYRMPEAKQNVGISPDKCFISAVPRIKTLLLGLGSIEAEKTIKVYLYKETKRKAKVQENTAAVAKLLNEETRATQWIEDTGTVKVDEYSGNISVSFGVTLEQLKKIMGVLK